MSVSLGPGPAPTPEPSPVVVGGAVVIGGTPVTPPPSTPAPVASDPTIIEKPPEIYCGLAGGVQVRRDTRNLSGANYNSINTINYTFNIVGKNVGGFEWGRYAHMINYSEFDSALKAEHCADYIKVEHRSTRTSWGSCIEMMDYTGKGATVAQEVDYWCMPEVPAERREDNGNRIFYDLMANGSNDSGTGPSVAGATAAIRTSGGNDLAYWSFGALFRAIRNTGVSVKSWLYGGIRGFELLGKWVVGLDTSQADVATAVRLAEGQVLALEQTDQITLRFFQGRTQIRYFGVPMLEVDGNGNLHVKGDIYRNGIPMPEVDGKGNLHIKGDIYRNGVKL